MSNSFMKFLDEAQMSDDEIKSACETLSKNGDAKAKTFADGLLKYFKENGSFHPNQVSGLQNLMKNASWQLSKDNITESAQMKLELLTKINRLLGSAEIAVLRRVAGLLEKAGDESGIDE